MEKPLISNESSSAITRSASAALRSEMPETPRLKLPEGKVSTATRKKFLPFLVDKTGGPKK